MKIPDSNTIRTLLLAILVLLAGVSVTHCAAKPERKSFRLSATPSSVNLSGALATQRILIASVSSNAARTDVTEVASFTSWNPDVATVTKEGEVSPKKDGQAIIVAKTKGVSVKISVSVTKMSEPIFYSFANDVVPILARQGCSMGSCHGAAQGKGGFRLSLRGYAPEIDLISITRQLGGRRICREAPEESLFLKKPLGLMPHRGGVRLFKESRDYGILLGWLKQGAPGADSNEPTLTKVEILPGDRTMQLGEKQLLLVRASFSDGHQEDVTNRALYNTNDPAVVSISETGLVRQQQPGETAVTAKYRDKMAVARFLAPFPQKVSEASFIPKQNYIDPLVNAKLKQLHIEPSGLCSEGEFLRRAYIDAIGTLPTAEEAQSFIADSLPNKRERLIDSLLQRPEYGMVWALKFGDLFVLRREYMHRKYAMQMQNWMMDQFNSNRPWDEMVTEILTATGSLDSHPGGLFYVSRAPQKEGQGYWIRASEPTGEMAAQVFLGNRIQCSKCHNHPTERYTQDDYYHFTALWRQTKGEGDNDDGVPEKLAGTDKSDIRQPRTGEIMTPRPLDRSDLGFGKEEDCRIKTAAWLVRQDDFARNIVNRYWARCFGSGIVEPVDDIRSTNPAKNEPLMRALCDDLRAHHFDLKYLLGAIMKSRTYQLSATPNATNKIDSRLFSHYPARRMGAEEVADAVAQVTGVSDRFNGMGSGARACELADTEIPSIMLDTFGRPARVQPSDSERNCNPAISQALALLNSEELQSKLKSDDCVLNSLLKSGKPDAEILNTLFLSSFARFPSPTESVSLLKAITSAPKREEGFQDALWALLNSKEFLFNH